MTFSLVARCERSGNFGVVVTSSSPCVASRCAWARAGAGAVASQNITDPRLGHLGLELLAGDIRAEAVRDMLVRAGDYPEYRQLTVVDRHGGVAHHSGANTLGVHAVAVGSGCVAAGNILASPQVPQAMIDGFMREPGLPLAPRLLSAVRAGEKAGGEQGPVRSAGLQVVQTQVWPIIDLRVDWHDEAIAELGRVWEIYEPQVEDYLRRAERPGDAPSYGVDGDP